MACKGGFKYEFNERTLMKAPFYKLTSDHIFYYEGNAIHFLIGTRFELAGLELSKHTSNSPFKWNNDIIRLPNSILQKV